MGVARLWLPLRRSVSIDEISRMPANTSLYEGSVCLSHRVNEMTMAMALATKRSVEPAT